VRIVWLEQARLDLQSIHDFIAADSPAVARSFAQRLVSSVEALVEFPRRGRAGRTRGTFELLVTGTAYVAVYRLRDDQIQILSVQHGARRP